MHTSKENHQREEERKQREARKAMLPKKKRVAADSAADSGEEDTDSAESFEGDIDIIDNLLQKIKVGDILRPPKRNQVPTEEDSGEGAKGADEKAGAEATDSGEKLENEERRPCTLV